MSSSARKVLSGHRLLYVADRGPAGEAGLTAFLDIIVAVDGTPTTDESIGLGSVFLPRVGKMTAVNVFNLKTRAYRKVNLTPRRDWGGPGVLGLVARFDVIDPRDAFFSVSSVVPKSPAAEAGLLAGEDFILGCEFGHVRNELDLHMVLNPSFLAYLHGRARFQRDHPDEELPAAAALPVPYEDLAEKEMVTMLFVYNSPSDTVRYVGIAPTPKPVDAPPAPALPPLPSMSTDASEAWDAGLRSVVDAFHAGLAIQAAPVAAALSPADVSSPPPAAKSVRRLTLTSRDDKLSALVVTAPWYAYVGMRVTPVTVLPRDHTPGRAITKSDDAVQSADDRARLARLGVSDFLRRLSSAELVVAMQAATAYSTHVYDLYMARASAGSSTTATGGSSGEGGKAASGAAAAGGGGGDAAGTEDKDSDADSEGEYVRGDDDAVSPAALSPARPAGRRTRGELKRASEAAARANARNLGISLPVGAGPMGGSHIRTTTARMGDVAEQAAAAAIVPLDTGTRGLTRPTAGGGVFDDGSGTFESNQWTPSTAPSTRNFMARLSTLGLFGRGSAATSGAGDS